MLHGAEDQSIEVCVCGLPLDLADGVSARAGALSSPGQPGLKKRPAGALSSPAQPGLKKKPAAAVGRAAQKKPATTAAPARKNQPHSDGEAYFFTKKKTFAGKYCPKRYYQAETWELRRELYYERVTLAQDSCRKQCAFWKLCVHHVSLGHSEEEAADAFLNGPDF